MSDTQLELIMLIGAPCTGKSTYIKKYENDKSYVILSTDDYIQAYADASGKTYNEVFKEVIKSAEFELMSRLQYAIAAKKNIIWDQTNMTIASRAKKLNKVPSNYVKKAVVLYADLQTIKERNKNRPGKVIPFDVIQSMLVFYQKPTSDEGFSTIEFIGSDAP